MSSSSISQDAQFLRRKINVALDRVKQILDISKHPIYPSEVKHTYNDKYLLAESLTNTAIAAHLNCLSSLGLGESSLRLLLDWINQKKSVTFRFNCNESCIFINMVDVEVDSDKKLVSKINVGTMTSTWTSKVVTTVKEYNWKVELSYELVAFWGADDQIDDRVVIRNRKCICNIKTSTDTNPRPNKIHPKIDIDATWLLKHIQPEGLGLKFQIDRNQSSCRTPRRNVDVEAAQNYFTEFGRQVNKLESFFYGTLFRINLQYRVEESAAINVENVFVPVLPLFLDPGSESNDSTLALETHPDIVSDDLVQIANSSPILDLSMINIFLGEEARSLREKCSSLETVYPASTTDSLLTVAEATFIAIMKHAADVSDQYILSVSSIEAMLEEQLVAAIGREVSANDFSKYMRYHNHKLFKEEYAPKPLSYFIRRSSTHSPEGSITIEEKLNTYGDDIPEPILTLTRVIPGHDDNMMEFPLSASTNVKFGGERYLHAWMSHRFSTSILKQGSSIPSSASRSTLSLLCRAKQFSSFIVLIGRIASMKQFQPTYGMIIQNKDEVNIPLDLEQIPTAKEFRDSIDSLSPEQQRFAKAYRSLQLEGTVFGVCIIQIKPQLEMLLHLDPDSLTKEIALTQDLMELLIKYQIPSDILAYDGEATTASTPEKLAAVRLQVTAMQAMINQSKEKEIEEEKKVLSYNDPTFTANANANANVELMHACDYQKSAPLMSKMNKGYMMSMSFGKMDAVPLSSDYQEEPSFKVMDTPRTKGSGGGFGGLPLPPPAAPAASSRRLKSSSEQEELATTPGFGSCSKILVSPAPGTATTSTTLDTTKSPTDSILPVSNDSDVGNNTTTTTTNTSSHTVDFTKFPREFDQVFDKYIASAAPRPTIIKPGGNWSLTSQVALLAKPKKTILREEQKKGEKDRAFDLLEALSGSGALPMTYATLHVVLATTNCFDESVMETVIQCNENPIEKVERAMLVLGSVVYRVSPMELVQEGEQVERLTAISPMLRCIE